MFEHPPLRARQEIAERIDRASRRRLEIEAKKARKARRQGLVS